MPSSHFPSVPLTLVSASASASASASVSACPSVVPGTPDEGDEVLYDKDILNNPVWHGAAV